tara:strand:- start:44108 stop:44560 length:453 start_codon:yes stop_codon:yes gene_type:complete
MDKSCSYNYSSKHKELDIKIKYIHQNPVLVVHLNELHYTGRFGTTKFYTEWTKSKDCRLYSMGIAISIEKTGEYVLSTFYFHPYSLMYRDGENSSTFYDLLTSAEKEFFKGLGHYLLHVLIVHMLEVIPDLTVDTVLHAYIENGKIENGI